jgi:parallel beta-helix repeat protein
MKEQVMLAVILVIFASPLLFNIHQVKADTTIHILQNGSIEGTNLIICNGTNYTFTAKITAPIIIEKNNIVLDGADYTLEGHRTSIAINLTCTNVTVKNVRITDWSTGILGVYNNNTIKDVLIDGCDYGIKIYADKYRIMRNTIAHNSEGIRLHGGENIIASNNITANKYGIYLQGYASNQENTIIENTIAKNELGMFIFYNTWGIQQVIYHNNFIQNTGYVGNTGNGLNGSLPGKTSSWSKDSEGNYWSDYNESDADKDGIGDAPYHIDVSNDDNYPLTTPFVASECRETPAPTRNPTSTPASKPTPTSTESANPSPSNSELPAQSPQTQTISTLPPEITIALVVSLAANVILALTLICKKKPS